MSATLESGKFSEFFGCDVFEVPGRTFPVKVRYLNLVTPADLGSSGYISKAVDKAFDIHLRQPPGDVLVFLTGRAEIERACDDLFARSEKLDYYYDVDDKRVTGLMILPIYGALPVKTLFVHSLCWGGRSGLHSRAVTFCCSQRPRGGSSIQLPRGFGKL